MVTKKDLVIVVLATFCLTATLFMILPSRSTERDPWADVSGPTQGVPDGTINMRDINYEIQHFNQDVSNMTRTVNALEATYLYNPPMQYFNAYESWSSSDLNTTGFREFTVDIYANGTFYLYMYQSLYGPNGGTSVQSEHATISGVFQETYIVLGNTLYFYVQNTQNATANMRISVYMHSIPSPQSEPKDKTIWVGDYLTTFNGTSGGSGGYIRYGEIFPYVGGYEKMTVIFKFPDQMAYIDERTIYVFPSLQWRLDSYDYYAPTEHLTTTLYQVQGGQYHYQHQISSDSYLIEKPYVSLYPDMTWPWPPQIGNLTVSVYLYLSNGPIASSTRKTMEWSEWREINSSDAVSIGGIDLKGFTQLTVILSSNVTWNVRIGWGAAHSENILLEPPWSFMKTYELAGDAWLNIYLQSPSATPSYVSASFYVIA